MAGIISVLETFIQTTAEELNEEIPSTTTNASFSLYKIVVALISSLSESCVPEMLFCMLPWRVVLMSLASIRLLVSEAPKPFFPTEVDDSAERSDYLETVLYLLILTSVNYQRVCTPPLEPSDC